MHVSRRSMPLALAGLLASGRTCVERKKKLQTRACARQAGGGEGISYELSGQHIPSKTALPRHQRKPSFESSGRRGRTAQRRLDGDTEEEWGGGGGGRNTM